MREIRPIAGANVWHGRDMAGSPRWQRRLDAAQLAELDAALARAEARGLAWETMTADDFPLPGLAPLIADIRDELEDGSGLLLLRGLDPSRYTLAQAKLLYAGLCRQIGTPVYSNRSGEIMREIRDIGADVGRRFGALDGGAFLSSYSRTLSNGPLRYHTDRCDVVALFCIRQALTGGLSRLCSSPAVHNLMLEGRRAVRGCLAQPLRRGGRGRHAGLSAPGVGAARRPLHQPLFAHLHRGGAAPPGDSAADPGPGGSARPAARAGRRGELRDELCPRRHPVRQQPRDLPRPHRLYGRSGERPRPAPLAAVAGDAEQPRPARGPRGAVGRHRRRRAARRHRPDRHRPGGRLARRRHHARPSAIRGASPAVPPTAAAGPRPARRSAAAMTTCRDLPLLLLHPQKIYSERAPPPRSERTETS